MSSATFKMAAAKKRGADPELIVPADPVQRARYEAAFARFCSVFPDAFYISERARVYLDPEKEKDNAGRLLSAGLHSMTGYFRDDGPLYDLILDEAGPARTRPAVGGVRFHRFACRSGCTRASSGSSARIRGS